MGWSGFAKSASRRFHRAAIGASGGWEVSMGGQEKRPICVRIRLLGGEEGLLPEKRAPSREKSAICPRRRRLPRERRRFAGEDRIFPEKKTISRRTGRLPRRSRRFPGK